MQRFLYWLLTLGWRTLLLGFILGIFFLMYLVFAPIANSFMAYLR